MRKFLLFTLLLSQLASCRSVTSFDFGGNFRVPNGTPSFQQGFKDGCSTASYSRGNMWFRTRYGYRYDPKMIGNAEYRLGHSRGYSWCFMQAMQGTTGPTGSPDKYLMPYGKSAVVDYDPNSMNNAWGGFFGGLQAPGNSTSTAGGIDGSLSILQGGISGGEAGAGQSAFGNPLWSGESSTRFMGIW